MQPAVRDEPLCPVCKRPAAIPDHLTLPTKWRWERQDGGTVYYMLTAEGRLAAQVWQNHVNSADFSGSTLTDWHWQFHRLDQCCGTNPGGNAQTKSSAQTAAENAFRRHAAEHGVVLAELGGQGPRWRWRRIA